MTGNEKEALKNGASVIHSQMTILVLAIKNNDSDKAWKAWDEIRAATDMIKK